jgi:hypothetical protein
MLKAAFLLKFGYKIKNPAGAGLKKIKLVKLKAYGA